MEKRANKLISEKSPYLLQHCYNPVEWYPWGDDAFKRAKELNRPIFLSVGYSTCHWCHVMEHESFENEQIGKLMNENFVSIKVDREERPDVDKLYMSFVQATTGGGGWPMSVFLTPDLEPIVGGTYFPPEDSYGRPGFASILTMIANKWKTKQPEVQGQGRQLKDAICGAMKQKPVNESQQLPAASTTMQKLYDKFASTFDAKNGGFGGAPKFPKPVDLDFLLSYHVAMRKTDGDKAQKALSMVERTLEKMAAGGIHDHVGKGFHRYSVDATWHVPHFEKMLYDQGQLLATYANFCKLHAGRFKDVVVDIADYVRDNLTSPVSLKALMGAFYLLNRGRFKKGGFYCAEDADSLPTVNADKKKEGAFCVWTKGEIQEVLGDRPLRHNENITLDELACALFQVQDGGNVSPASDPHGELKKQNVLKMVDKEKLEALASEYHLTFPQLAECIGDVKRFLAERRAQRPRPHLDNKILTSWNALAIEGLATAANALRVMDPTRADGYQFMAQQAVEFVREHLSTGDEHEELLRAAYVDANQEVIRIRAPIHAFADDYAFLISALLALYETNFDEALLQWAQELQRIMDLLFWDTDSNSGYYLARADDPSIFARQQEDQDGAEPSTNSVAVYNLLRLHAILGTKEYRQNAENIFRGAADRLEKFPIALPKMVTALNAHHNSFPEIVVVGHGRTAGSTEDAMLALVQSKFIPFKTLVFIDASRDDSWLVEKNERYKTLVDAYKKDVKPAVYICGGNACQAPIHTLNEMQTVFAEF